MAVPVLIAWGAPSLVDVSEGDGEYVYAHLFELVVGASGFRAQDRHHGMVGCPCEVLTPVDGSHEMIDFRVLPSEEAEVYSMGDTSPEDLQPWHEQIMDDYVLQAGSVYEPVDG
jgi:hypothetical protein